MYRTRIMLSFCLLAVILAGLVYFLTSYASDESNPELSEDFWVRVIQERGGYDAYQFFAERVAGYTEPDKHLAAHEFGAALYTVEGVESLGVCDDRYGYGCFHQFMGYALSEHGLSAAESLNEACFSVLKENWAWCHHAIGHGLISTIGYEKKDLIEALSICDQLPHPDPVGGCFGGVFMEYNMRTMLGDESVRTFSGEPSELCESMDEKYRRVCFYWLPQWWYASHLKSVSDDAAFMRMGRYCDELAEDSVYVESCYRGIGLITPQVSLYDPRLGYELCTVASHNVSRALACLSSAASVIGAVANKEDAEILCEGLSTSSREYCFLYASGTASQANPLPLPETIM